MEYIEKNKNLWIVAGPPASGKSTWIKNKIKEIGGAWISRDKIRNKILQPGDAHFSKEKRVYKEFIDAIYEAFENGENNVFADATHLNKYSRTKLISALKNYSLGNVLFNKNIIVTNFGTSLENCLERNAKRTGERECVPEQDLINMYKSYEPAILEENYFFSKIINVSEDELNDIFYQRSSSGA